MFDSYRLDLKRFNWAWANRRQPQLSGRFPDIPLYGMERLKILL